KRIFSTFIENRLNEIRLDSEIIYHYIASSDNPADCATRGLDTKDLKDNQLWWYGPKWLGLASDDWPIWKLNNIDSGIQSEEENKTKPSRPMYEAKLVAGEGCRNKKDVSTKVSAPLNIDIHRFSSLIKLLRVTALALRFIKKLQKISQPNKQLDSEEIYQAEKLWIRYVQRLHYDDIIHSILSNKPNNVRFQLGVYLDNENILRCHGRLENAELTEGARIPILLPKSDRFTQLLIERTHGHSLHVGVSQTLALVRQKYWIPRGRSAVKAVLLKCSVCRHSEGGPYKMPSMPPLPTKRVSQSAPFSYSGVDYFGPLYIKTKTETKKVWICLYTCLVTRAIHLELMSDMSTEQFLLGFRRFLARHGMPEEIISDNASQFKLASDAIDKIWRQILLEEDVLTYSANENIKWRYIIELAPWMGGYYERLIGLVKRSLRKAIGKLCMTYEQLFTILKEVEAVVNSRPLVYVEDDINSHITLTPSHFLTPNPKIGIPTCEIDNDDADFSVKSVSTDKLLLSWKKGLRHLDRFWKIWREEYLISLRERTQTKLKEARKRSHHIAQQGDIVLVKDDLPRGNWRVGRITDLITSYDKQVRAANVMLPSKRIISRPLCLLYPIEWSTSQNGENDSHDQESQAAQMSNHVPDEMSRQPKRQAAKKAAIKIKEQLQQ
ncbi:MAG: hypothetical protein AB2693_11425, partial [Candidatus Thiodiazotropha sp.]